MMTDERSDGYNERRSVSQTGRRWYGMVVAAAPIDKLVIRGGVGQVMPMNGPFYYCKCIYMFLSLLKMVPPDKYATLPSLSGCVCVLVWFVCTHQSSVCSKYSFRFAANDATTEVQRKDEKGRCS